MRTANVRTHSDKSLELAAVGLPFEEAYLPLNFVFGPNPVGGLVITNTNGRITLKLRVLSPPAQYTPVQGAAPIRTGVRCVQHFPFLGLLPPPIDGWSDITELYLARYGVPKADPALTHCWLRAPRKPKHSSRSPLHARGPVPLMPL